MTIEQRTLARCNEIWCTDYTSPDEIKDELDRDYYDGRVEAAMEQRQIDTALFIAWLTSSEDININNRERCLEDLHRLFIKGTSMTREELIEKARGYNGSKLAFIDGAEWMQARLIDKACKWLKIHGGMYAFEVKNFKEAMENEDN